MVCGTTLRVVCGTTHSGLLGTVQRQLVDRPLTRPAGRQMLDRTRLSQLGYGLRDGTVTGPLGPLLAPERHRQQLPAAVVDARRLAVGGRVQSRDGHADEDAERGF